MPRINAFPRDQATTIMSATPHQFLLIQEGEVVDHADKPSSLMWSTIDQYAGFQVAIGTVNEFGAKEIAGVVAVVDKLAGYNTWFVTSYQDGYRREVSAAMRPGTFVLRRLSVAYENGDFRDLVNLPEPILAQAGRKADAPLAAKVRSRKKN
jgi:hypothetical protein